MNKKKLLLGLAACLVAAACDHETREGKLTLNGSAPVRIVDEGGKTVDFVSGPLKVDFSANGSKFTVSLEQSGRKAKFSGKVPNGDSWDFTMRGVSIGQPVDLTSARKLELYGERRTSVGNGGSCGMNGTYVTEETWQDCREDWTVSFSDAQNSVTRLGTFASHREKESCLVDVRNLYCRERPERGGRDRVFVQPAAVKNLQAQVDSGIKFD